MDEVRTVRFLLRDLDGRGAQAFAQLRRLMRDAVDPNTPVPHLYEIEEIREADNDHEGRGAHEV